MPSNITPLAMTEGTAQRGRYDHRETGTKGDVYQNLGREPSGIEHPKKQGHENDPATNAEQAGEEASQTSKDSEQHNTQKTE
jgi:hypothetical protein